MGLLPPRTRTTWASFVVSEGRFSKTVLGAPVDDLSPVILRFITIEDNIVHNLTVNQAVIGRYVKVMRTLSLFSLRFLRILVHFGL